MNNKKVMKFGYEDTDTKIGVEIYGLEFEIKSIIEEKRIEELAKENSVEELDKLIEELLGEGAVKKINDKRNKDGYEDMDLPVKIAVISCIMESYIKGATEPISKRMDNIDNTYREFNNRANRRNYNKGYRGNRNYRRY